MATNVGKIKHAALALVLVTAGLACTPGAGGSTVTGGGGNNMGTGGRGGPGSGGSGTVGTGGSGPGTGGSGSVPPGSTIGPPPAFSPGRVTIRRLNTAEYDNTIRDLLGIDLKPSKMFEFVEDEWGDGFNNDADVLSLSPLSIEKFLTSAQALIDRAMDPAPANAAIRGRLMVCNVPMTAEAECGKRIVVEFARRAFRRPVADNEVGDFLTLIDLAKKSGDNFEVGVKLALSAILVSPEFLFRTELDPAPGVTRPLNDFELASRLSYFVWASMPDDELFTKAQMGQLKDPNEIGKQITRMLADQKSAGFVTPMVEQWMQTISLGFAKPDTKFYPTWTDPVRGFMEQEVRALLAPILAGQASTQDLLTAKYTYANRALGQYYGLPGAATLPTDRFDKVMLTDGRRGGVLRGGSFLVLTSHPDTHSPTRRGKWILDRLLCRHPPPPPGMIPAFEPTMIQAGTLREKLEKTHKAMGAACTGCHAFIDPMGFALENYDGAGLWRDRDNNLPIDATGTMPETGTPFNGAAELSNVMAADPRFPACVAKNVLTYALGRKMGDADLPAIEDMGKKFSAAGFKFPALVGLVATSPLMTHRQAEKE